MVVGGRHGPERAAADEPAVTEPITLTDPDGAVTRVAPWSSWTREQTRAPGGEPSLVTRLERGQLWFSAGRRRSPWRHEVQVGPATVSTPRGRFQVTAEPDGGATIACLAGRTRVVTGLREPVLLGPDQSAAVSSDGRTLVVMDRNSLADAHLFGADSTEEPIDLTDGAADATSGGDAALVGAGAAALAGGGSGGDDGPVDGGDGGSGGGGDRSGGADGSGGGDGSGPGDGSGAPSPWYRRGAEIAAVAALIAVLIAAVLVFGQGSDEDVASAPVDRTVVDDDATTSTATSTTSSSTTSTTSTTTSTTSTTTTSTTTAPRPVVRPGSAEGSLGRCRRVGAGVEADVVITHRSGGPGRFTAEVGLTDEAGAVSAKGTATSGVIPVGGSERVTVVVPVSSEIQGACELLGVTTA